MKQQKRYSEAFKLKVLEEYKTGRWASLTQVAEAYNVGYNTLTKWMVQYGHEHLINRRIYVATADEKSELKRLREENKRLKANLEDAMIEYYVERAFVSILCEETGQTREDLKKKDGFLRLISRK